MTLERKTSACDESSTTKKRATSLLSPEMLLTLLSSPNLFIASPRRATTRLTTATVGPPDPIPPPPDRSEEMFLPPITAFVSRSICCQEKAGGQGEDGVGFSSADRVTIKSKASSWNNPILPRAPLLSKIPRDINRVRFLSRFRVAHVDRSTVSAVLLRQKTRTHVVFTVCRLTRPTSAVAYCRQVGSAEYKMCSRMLSRSKTNVSPSGSRLM